MSAWSDLKSSMGARGGAGAAWSMAGLFALLVLGLEVWGWSLQRESKDIADAVAEVRDARPKVVSDKTVRERAQKRYGTKAPELATFLEEKAKSATVSLADTQPQAEVPSERKQFVERGAMTHLRKVGLKPIVSFLEAIEAPHFPLAVTKLNLRKRSTEANSYDVEVGVSAYDRKESDKKKTEATP